MAPVMILYAGWAPAVLASMTRATSASDVIRLSMGTLLRGQRGSTRPTRFTPLGREGCGDISRFRGDTRTVRPASPAFPLDNLKEPPYIPLGILKERQVEKLDVPQGTLDLMILTILAREPMHGYGVSQRLTVLSRGSFQVNPGSLFPSLYRLEQDGKLKADWRPTANKRRAKY